MLVRSILSQQQQLENLLLFFPGLFSTRPWQAEGVQHVIETPPGQVSRTALRPLPRSQSEVVDKEVQDMLQLGVFEPSNSAWHSPIVLGPKPDGSIRFCIDFRVVNKLATFNAYPFRWTDVLLSQIGDARYMSALDLTKGYWQVLMREQDKPQMAFATPQGLFQFKVMPFGLHGAAATFQWLVDTILGPCHGFTLAYIDIIIIYSRTWADHLEHLRRVFHCLRTAGLKDNPKKSHLGFTMPEYLGYIVGGGHPPPTPNPKGRSHLASALAPDEKAVETVPWTSGLL